MTWIQKSFLTAACLSLVLMISVTILGDHGVRDLRKLRGRLQEIVVENEKLAQENKLLAGRVDRLKNDPDYIEDMARQTLKLVRKGDIVVEVNPVDGKRRK